MKRIRTFFDTAVLVVGISLALSGLAGEQTEAAMSPGAETISTISTTADTSQKACAT